MHAWLRVCIILFSSCVSCRVCLLVPAAQGRTVALFVCVLSTMSWKNCRLFQSMLLLLIQQPWTGGEIRWGWFQRLFDSFFLLPAQWCLITICFNIDWTKSPSTLKFILEAIRSCYTPRSLCIQMPTLRLLARDAPASAFECLHVSIRSMQTCARCVQEAGITETHKQSSRLSYLPLSLTPLFLLPPPPVPTSSFTFSSLCSPFLSPPSLVFFTFLPLHSLSPSLALPLSLPLSHPPCFLASYAFILLSSLALHLPSLSCFPPLFLPLPPLLSSPPSLASLPPSLGLSPLFHPFFSPPLCSPSSQPPTTPSALLLIPQLSLFWCVFCQPLIQHRRAESQS